MYYTDYHTHTRLSPDGEFPLLQMAEAALAAGLSELCVTDHYDLVDLDGRPAAEPYPWASALEQWREAAERCRGRLTIRLGLEFGSADRCPDRARETLDQPELDFVIGSLHNLTPEAGAKDFYFVDYCSPLPGRLLRPDAPAGPPPGLRRHGPHHLPPAVHEHAGRTEGVPGPV